jgi:hypothetical protein
MATFIEDYVNTYVNLGYFNYNINICGFRCKFVAFMFFFHNKNLRGYFFRKLNSLVTSIMCRDYKAIGLVATQFQIIICFG